MYIYISTYTRFAKVSEPRRCSSAAAAAWARPIGMRATSSLSLEATSVHIYIYLYRSNADAHICIYVYRRVENVCDDAARERGPPPALQRKQKPAAVRQRYVRNARRRKIFYPWTLSALFLSESKREGEKGGGKKKAQRR